MLPKQKFQVELNRIEKKLLQNYKSFDINDCNKEFLKQFYYIKESAVTVKKE